MDTLHRGSWKQIILGELVAFWSFWRESLPSAHCSPSPLPSLPHTPTSFLLRHLFPKTCSRQENCRSKVFTLPQNSPGLNMQHIYIYSYIHMHARIYVYTYTHLYTYTHWVSNLWGNFKWLSRQMLCLLLIRGRTTGRGMEEGKGGH